MDHATLLDGVVDIARQAGRAILEVYENDDFGVEQKQDDSPLTRADLASHRCIVEGLRRLTPDIPVYSEESEGIAWSDRRDWQRFWLVDPLDGTKEFIKRNGEFTVNIALIEDGCPVLGVVHVPVGGATWLGGRDLGAFREDDGVRRPIRTRPVARPVIMVASRSHGTDRLQAMTDAIVAEFGAVDLTSMGSSLKLCLVAEGAADFYPRLAPTSEWDTAAAHAVVTAAGGAVVDTAFAPLRYNKEDILNPHFLVIGDSLKRWRFLQELLQRPD